jgi:hypothetical protein
MVVRITSKAFTVCYGTLLIVHFDSGAIAEIR